ncbi:MAG: hypothetical protein AAFQ98_01925 [Bacteroidota bacterium]
MQRNLLIFSALVILGASACSYNNPSPGLCLDGNCSFYFWEDLEMGITSQWDDYLMDTLPRYHNFAAGNQRVFIFENEHWENPAVADDELTEYFRFQVPMNADDFVLATTEDLANAQVGFFRSCSCFIELDLPTEGRIVGERVGKNVFKVTVDISFESNGEQQSLTFTRRMRYQKTPDWVFN